MSTTVTTDTYFYFCYSKHRNTYLARIRFQCGSAISNSKIGSTIRKYRNIVVVVVVVVVVVKVVEISSRDSLVVSSSSEKQDEMKRKVIIYDDDKEVEKNMEFPTTRRPFHDFDANRKRHAASRFQRDARHAEVRHDTLSSRKRASGWCRV